MSWIDYLRLQNYLNNPGTTISPWLSWPNELITVTVGDDKKEDRDPQSVIVHEQQGSRSRKICTHKFNEDEYRDSMSMLAEAAATLLGLDNRNTPAIDRLALNDMKVLMRVDHSLEPIRPTLSSDGRLISNVRFAMHDPLVSISLPPWRCSACRGMGFQRWSVPVKSKEEPPFTFPLLPDTWEVEERPCRTCHGSGRVFKHKWMKPHKAKAHPVGTAI